MNNSGHPQNVPPFQMTVAKDSRENFDVFPQSLAASSRGNQNHFVASSEN